MIGRYPKRLIEVDLPIKRISAHARREKSIRHGHISTLHIWWARRPLAACRAVTCAALWIDPADPLCPQAFRDKAMKILLDFAKKAVSDKTLSEHCSTENWAKWSALVKQETTLDSKNESHLNVLRFALLDFIADFANWDNSTVKEYLETSRALTQAAHEALGGEKGTRPLVVDPFAGGGSIPLEALRVGADVFASDLNPVAVLLNKVVVEYIPKHGIKLADELKKWGQWVKEEAEKELAEFYPKGDKEAIPVAYLWARTIRCEGPGCGVEVPLMRSFWLAKKANRSVAFSINAGTNKKSVSVRIVEDAKAQDVIDGTIRRGSVTCPVCGYTTPIDRVRNQLQQRHGGTDDAMLLAVVEEHNSKGTLYRQPTSSDFKALSRVTLALHNSSLKIPNEATPTNQSHRSVGSPFLYGMTKWGDLFLPRQKLALSTLSKLVRAGQNNGMPEDVQTILSLCVSKLAGFLSSLCMWRTTRTCVAQTFGRQALPQVWDFGEMNPFAGSAGDWSECVRYVEMFVEQIAGSVIYGGTAVQSDATNHPMPSDSVALLCTDPPYYDAVAYAQISDFFYVWLKRSLPPGLDSLFSEILTPKEQQAVVLHPNSKDERLFFERKMTEALSEARRVVNPAGLGVVVFAHKSTHGWEAQLQAMLQAGWSITASWPIDTEREGRINANNTASLASSIHLVCRPRENPDGSVSENYIGDWRDVLQELPIRIHDWMPRLAHEGVVGADAIFACLGPALEIFSRYSKVEKASGESVPLKEYLEHVWAVVAKEALDMVFAGAQTSDFEEDARLTAMWLWTLSTGGDGNGVTEDSGDESAEDEESGSSKKPTGGFVLEYDAARKIAQGLGAHLEQLQNLVEAKGETARLLPVSERARYLFGKDAVEAPKKKKKKSDQINLFSELGIEEEGSTGFDLHTSGKIGETVLDRLHQSMILFATGRSEALKRFLVEDGVGQDQRYWRLAQAFSALYPASSEEKRWVDGVLARKKGLGF